MPNFKPEAFLTTAATATSTATATTMLLLLLPLLLLLLPLLLLLLLLLLLHITTTLTTAATSTYILPVLPTTLLLVTCANMLQNSADDKQTWPQTSSVENPEPRKPANLNLNPYDIESSSTQP